MSTQPTALEEAERAGLDLSLVEANLSYSYDERALRHDRVLALLIELEEAGHHVVGRLGCVITLDDLLRAREALRT